MKNGQENKLEPRLKHPSHVFYWTYQSWCLLEAPTAISLKRLKLSASNSFWPNCPKNFRPSRVLVALTNS